MTDSGQFEVQVQSATEIPRIAWPDLADLRNLCVKVLVRTGSMYDLYSLNQAIEVIAVRSAPPVVETEGGTLRAVGEAAGPDVKVCSEVIADAETGELQLTVKFVRTEASSRKLQFQYEVGYSAPDGDRGVALVLPARGRIDVLRPSDPSGQQVYDQDGHTRFPRTVRLSRNYGVLASMGDRKGIRFSGDNVRFVSAFINYQSLPDTRFFWVYGRDVVLDKGEEHAETVTLRLVDGLGGASFDPDDALAGAGALLQRRCVTEQDRARVLFTAGGRPARTGARVTRGHEVVLAESGRGDLELDLSALPDGDYEVIKELDLGDSRLRSAEPLTILRHRLAELDERAEAARSFAARFEPAAAADPQLARLRLDLVGFKLEEARAYRALHEIEQMDGLLRDAERAVKALSAGEPAAMPPRGKLIYASDLAEDSDEFLVYGNADITFSRDTGMLLEPVGTVNLWTRREVQGSFIVEFDYYPYESRRGGTMVQLCGTHPNPISQYDFMCSASYGSMAYYMFGVNCYHFSFSRWGGLVNSPDRVCNFRKTGRGFYVLSRIPDPIREVERWYRLAFVKHGRQFMFFVDGELVQEYSDEGAQGPLLNGGRIGIRNWSAYRSRFKDLKVHAVAP